MKEVKTITDVRFYNAADEELLHIPDPEFVGDEGMTIKFPEGAAVATSTYMIVTYDDGRTDRVNLREAD